MRAIVQKEGRTVFAGDVPDPELDPREVLVRVNHAAICRTDLYVAEGRIEVPNGLILGHEFGGVVVEAGDGVDRQIVGSPVLIDPTLPCGECEDCRNHKPHQCGELGLLGVNRNGAFAEFVGVGADRVHKLPEGVPPKLATYAEPIAAALAVLEVGLDRGDRILVYGTGRIVDLCGLVLQTAGFTDVTFGAPDSDRSRLFDVVVECGLRGDELTDIIPRIRPGGCLVLKSRAPEATSLPSWSVVKRRVKIVPAHYAAFDSAIEFLTAHSKTLDGYLGQSYGLEKFEQAFSDARKSEAKKLSFQISD